MSRLSRIFDLLFCLPYSIYFNFRHLPFNQAIHLPILLRNAHIGIMKGRIRIAAPVRRGMIRLGFHSVSIYPPMGIRLEMLGGTLKFTGPCCVGSGSAISIGPKGYLSFGRDVMANANVKFVAYHSITLGDNVRIAWENIIMDTDMHALTKPDGTTSKGYGSINIGHHCWLGTGCLVLKNTVLPPYTTVQAHSVLSRKADIPPKCVIGSSTDIIIKATDTWRDLDNDSIQYPDLDNNNTADIPLI